MIVIGGVNCGLWLRRLIAWDGTLPGCIVAVPAAIEALFPKHRGVIEVTAVMLPILAFFLRIIAGMRHIASNRCSTAVRRFQVCVFCIGVFPLVLIDCFLILSHVMPKGAGIDEETSRVACAIIAIYLTSMAVAMYPGRDAPTKSDFARAEFGASRSGPWATDS
jgi:hypothetical protein